MGTMALAMAWTVSFAAAGCGSGGGGGGGGNGAGDLGPLDSRCTALCASSDNACTSNVAQCQPVCQVRVAGMSSLCATCLLQGSNSGACGGNGPCCPNPEFPQTVVDCASSCVGSAGVNPSGDHPICTDICSSGDATCTAQVTQCLQQCDARVHGVSGLCALCLLEGANGGACPGGAHCCPSPEFADPTPCASVCGH
jgi:hypothetical protein